MLISYCYFVASLRACETTWNPITLICWWYIHHAAPGKWCCVSIIEAKPRRILREQISSMTLPFLVVYLSHLTWPIQPPEPKVCRILMAPPIRLVASHIATPSVSPRCCSHIAHIFGALLSELVHHNCVFFCKTPQSSFLVFFPWGPFCKNSSYSNRRSQNQHILEGFFNRPLQGFCPISSETSMDGTARLFHLSSNLLGIRSGFGGWTHDTPPWDFLIWDK